MSSSALREKSAGFAKDIVFTVRDLREKHVESAASEKGLTQY